jgi:hypothetical protein
MGMLPSSWTFPDLLITVDFSILGINPSDALPDARFKVVSIVIGLAANFDDVWSTTTPIPMYSESYMLGSLSFNLRRKYLKPWLATFASLLAVSIYSEYFENRSKMTDLQILIRHKGLFLFAGFKHWSLIHLR